MKYEGVMCQECDSITAEPAMKALKLINYISICYYYYYKKLPVNLETLYVFAIDAIHHLLIKTEPMPCCNVTLINTYSGVKRRYEETGSKQLWPQQQLKLLLEKQHHRQLRTQPLVML